MRDYDVIVVGAGAAGGIIACVLAEAGRHVLLLERGRALTRADVGRDHLRNQRISLYGHNAGPDIDGNPRTVTNSLGQSVALRPHQGGYENNAACVGSGTLVYGAQAWRFMEQDFRMATHYGVPEGSSLADWPIAYQDLAPYYERAEWELGVCGDGAANRFQSPRRKGYPMPPIAGNRSGALLKLAADSLGWNTFPVPLLINSTPYNGREECVHCQHCVGFACPTDAKNGTQNTVIPRALATDNCELVTRAMASSIDTDAQGRAIGLTYFTEQDGTIRRETARSKAVVVSAGAIETPRLLLNSASPMHPHGLGNRYDQVGRHLHGHYYPGAMGLMEETIHDNIGPGPTIATCQFSHDNPGIIGGGMIANEFVKLPILHWYRALPPDLPRWGLENKRWMRENYGRTLHVMGPVQDIPNPACRVTLDTNVRDRYGLPVAHLSGRAHPETVHTARFMWEQSLKWLKAAGAIKIWGEPPGLYLSAGQHQAGTCRMGSDPHDSVTDRWGRVHDQDNLYVVDASLHVTNGGFNPVLTVMALAFRSAGQIAASL